VHAAVFSAKPYDREYLGAAARVSGHELTFFEPRLLPETAILAEGHKAICCFVNDQLSADVLSQIHSRGTRFIALRCAGFNQVDLAAAQELGLKVARVPAYSPHSVAEHTVGLILTLNRKFHKAYQRVRDGNFALDQLVGFDLHGKTVGVVGTGKIGAIAANILHGFGCRILMHDRFPNDACRQIGEYVDLEPLLQQSDIVTLHCPLTPETKHMIGTKALAGMKRGAMLINTSRGGLVNTRSVIESLKLGHLGYLGLDVYEEEGDLFFDDHSADILKDDVFARLLTFPNVVVTSHQAFFTRNALEEIGRVTMKNLSEFESNQALTNEVSLAKVR
jgi:D-lactate dehydrogenase